jgi:hypothetical protein
MRAPGSDDAARSLVLVAAKVVHDDHIALPEGGGEDGLHIEQEEFAVDRPIDHPRGVEAVVA